MDVLRPLFDAFVAHAYLVVVVGALIDATGLPSPPDPARRCRRVRRRRHASLIAFVALGALGAMLTDQVWFWTASRGSAWLMDVYCRLTRRRAAAPTAAWRAWRDTDAQRDPRPLLHRRARRRLAGAGAQRDRLAALRRARRRRRLVWSAIWWGSAGSSAISAGRGAVGERLADDRGRRVRRRPGAPLALRAWRRRARERSAH